jgi:cation transporter-like permease
MLRSLSRGTILASLTLMWVAAAWLVCDILFADPDLLVFEDVAILCAVLAPIVYLIGWGLTKLSLRLGQGGAPRRA